LKLRDHAFIDIHQLGSFEVYRLRDDNKVSVYRVYAQTIIAFVKVKYRIEITKVVIDFMLSKVEEVEKEYMVNVKYFEANEVHRVGRSPKGSRNRVKHHRSEAIMDRKKLVIQTEQIEVICSLCQEA
jgi:hypothetical protein